MPPALGGGAMKPGDLRDGLRKPARRAYPFLKAEGRRFHALGRRGPAPAHRGSHQSRVTEEVFLLLSVLVGHDRSTRRRRLFWIRSVTRASRAMTAARTASSEAGSTIPTLPMWTACVSWFRFRPTAFN